MKFRLLCKILAFSIIIDRCSTFIIPFLPDLLNNVNVDHHTSLELVKVSSAILPNFDSVGHTVLNLNEKMINTVINSHLNYDIKKDIILKIIKMTQQGDEYGGIILEHYYNFVDKIM